MQFERSDRHHPAQCPVCGSDTVLTRVVDLGQYDVFKCSQCDAETSVPLPTNDVLTSAYKGFDAGRLVRSHFEAYVRMARALLVRAAETIGKDGAGPGNTFLDYGCGGGHFVKAAEEIGFRAIGMEFDPISVAEGTARGLDVRHGSLPINPDVLGDEAFDFILSFHVLEHVAVPFLTFSALVEHTKSGGVIIIGVPDQRSLPALLKKLLWHFGIKKREWGYVQPPIHIHGFSARTLALLATRFKLRTRMISRVSPLDQTWFPSTVEYWASLPVQRLVYMIGKVARSHGYLFAVYEKA